MLILKIKLKFFYDKQYGFRKGRSTEHATLELIDGLIKDMDNGDIPICFFIDLSKAFDTLNHEVHLEKLNHHGVLNTAFKLFENYLSNRKQYVDFDGAKSDYLFMVTGVPQGSILGPLLFLIYMNDISNSSTLFKFILFADDTTLKTSINIAKQDQRSAKDLSNIINYEFNKVNTWLKGNKLSLNIEKTKFMVFHKKNKNVPQIDIRINGKLIEQVDDFCFLGLTIDSALDWSAHIRKISGKLNSAIGILNKLKYTAPEKMKVLVYNALFVSHINYCLLAWGYKIEALRPFQKSAVRIVTKSDYLAHSEPILKDLNLLKLDDILEQKKIKFYFKYLKNDLPKYFLDFDMKLNSDYHDHNTRHKNDFRPNKVNREYAEKCIRNELPHFINNLEDSLKSKFKTHSLISILKYHKKLRISEYNFECSDHLCYACLPKDHERFIINETFQE